MFDRLKRWRRPPAIPAEASVIDAVVIDAVVCAAAGVAAASGDSAGCHIDARQGVGESTPRTTGTTIRHLRSHRPLRLDGTLSIEAHARALADLLQAGITDTTVYTLGEVITGYAELCADEFWVQRSWDKVSKALRDHLGITKRYGSAVDPETGKRTRPVVFHVPAKASACALPEMRVAA